MGKKMKRKGSKSKSKSISEPSNSKSGSVDEVTKGREPCNRCAKGSVELDRILSRIRCSSDYIVRCEECRTEPAKKRGNKESSESDIIWVCLDCYLRYCGGAASGLEPHGHARRHAKKENHPWAVRFDSPDICWCFSCNSLVPIETLQGVDDDLKSARGIENVGCCGNAEQGKGFENGGKEIFSEGMRGYAVRGMVNLGNTCFFNSVMQNLLAMNILRDHLAGINVAFGPLTMALQNFFSETASVDSTGVLDPSTLFGCICVKASQFSGYQQQDSHELLRYLLDSLQSEEKMAIQSFVSSYEQGKGASSSDVTLVDAVFGGQLSSTVYCMECGHTSVVYEAFLDLSLPIPSKKPPPKKVPLSMPKRTKLPSREGKRGRKVREKGVAKGFPIIDTRKVESSSSLSECNQSCVPSSEQKQTVVVGADEYLIGMDCDGPSAMIDTADSVSQNREVCVAQSYENRQIYEGENYVKCTSSLQINLCPTEQVTSSDSCGASFCRDGNPSSCTQDSGVLLVPDKELDSVVEDKIRGNQERENVASVGSLVNESCAQTISVARFEQAEVDFHGFGDLFNEPEVTSDLKTKTKMGEEMARTLWGGNSSESNPDEVDSTSAPISLDSCLGLFTKPELLSDEHAWHCEYCSGNFPYQITEHRRSKRQAVSMLDQSETLKSRADEGEVGSKKSAPCLEVDFMESTEFKVSGNGNMITNSEDFVLHMEGFHNQNIDVDASQNPINPIRKSSIITCRCLHDGNDKSYELSNPSFSDKACCHNVLQKDADFTESDHKSQFLSCPSSHEASLLHEKSCQHESRSCSTNDQNSIGCGGQDLTTVLDGMPDQAETIPQSSCENDNFSEVNQVGKEGPQLLDEVHPANGCEREEMEIESRKIKRDATKRILIDRAPSILTIHLKRFRQDARGRLNKLRGYVSFQEILDLRPYMDPRSGEKEKCCYRLLGLVEHSGSMTRGHYVAYVRGERSRVKPERGGAPAWFYASDSHVREISLSEVLRSEAYILFYERV